MSDYSTRRESYRTKDNDKNLSLWTGLVSRIGPAVFVVLVLTMGASSCSTVTSEKDTPRYDNALYQLIDKSTSAGFVSDISEAVCYSIRSPSSPLSMTGNLALDIIANAAAGAIAASQSHYSDYHLSNTLSSRLSTTLSKATERKDIALTTFDKKMATESNKPLIEKNKVDEDQLATLLSLGRQQELDILFVMGGGSKRRGKKCSFTLSGSTESEDRAFSLRGPDLLVYNVATGDLVERLRLHRNDELLRPRLNKYGDITKESMSFVNDNVVRIFRSRLIDIFPEETPKPEFGKTKIDSDRDSSQDFKVFGSRKPDVQQSVELSKEERDRDMKRN